MSRLSRLLAAFTVGAALLGACGGATSAPSSSESKQSFSTVEPGTFTVGVYQIYIPVMIVSGNTIAGVDGAWMTQFAKDHNLKLKPFQTTFASTILAVQQNRIDVALAYYYTPARSQSVYYTYPFDQEGARVFTLATFNYTGPESLNGQKVATVQGFAWNSQLQQAFGSNLVQYATKAEAQTAVNNGQVKALFAGNLGWFDPPWSGTDTIAPHVIKPGDFGFPASLIDVYDYNVVNCNNKGLAKALNDELGQMKNSGTWDTIMKDNFKVNNPPFAPLESPQQGC
jgi:ABC-type amino acid transport substrate-binding protein